MEPIHYRLSFEETVEQVCNEVDRWFAGPKKRLPEIEQFPDPIYFKSSSSMILHANPAYHEFFSRGVAAIGRLATSFLDNSVVRASEHSDALILEGSDYVEFEHYCVGPENRWHRIRTFKKGLLKYPDGAFDILGISRPVAKEPAPTKESRDSIESKYHIFKKMDLDDRQICNLIAEGRSTKEIASTLEVTPKTIENRRRRILGNLEYEQVIEIVKMMVRFEERGFEF